MEINHHEEELARHLFEALYELMQTRPIDEISVGEILEKAHVSRSSFYRRYRDKYELLSESYKRMMEKTFLRCTKGGSWRESAAALYQVLGEHPKFFKHAVGYTGPNNLRDSISEVCLGVVEERFRQHGRDLHDDWRLLTAARAYVLGTLDVTYEWALADMPYPAEELIDLLCDLIPESIRPYCT